MNEIWVVVIHDRAFKTNAIDVWLFYTEEAAQEHLMHYFDVNDPSDLNNFDGVEFDIYPRTPRWNGMPEDDL